MKPLISAACAAAAAAATAAGATAAPPGARHPATAPARRAPAVAAPRVIQLPDHPAAGAAAGALDDDARRCPAAFRGADLDLRAIPGGVALQLTSAQPALIADLREQVREAAIVLAQYSHAPPPMSDPARSHLPRLEVAVMDIGAGALVLVRTQRARDLPELLELAHTFEILWSRSDCVEDVYVRSRARLPYLQA